VRLGKAIAILHVVSRIVAMLFELLALSMLLLLYPRLKLLLWSARLRITVARLPPSIKRLVLQSYSRARRRALETLSLRGLLRQFLG